MTKKDEPVVTNYDEEGDTTQPPGPYLSRKELEAGMDKVRKNLPPYDDGRVRTFGSGATRDTSTDKPEFAGFLSPAVIRAFGRYMHTNRKQSDGSLRDSDNWKKGMPRRVFVESMFRHFIDVWGFVVDDDDIPGIREDDAIDALMAIIFNAQGLAREILRGRDIQ